MTELNAQSFIKTVNITVITEVNPLIERIIQIRILFNVIVLLPLCFVRW